MIYLASRVITIIRMYYDVREYEKYDRSLGSKVEALKDISPQSIPST
jgi:hypothetical protein